MKKPQWILIGITIMFVCVMLGVFLGRNTGHAYISLNNTIETTTDETAVNTQNKDGKININTATIQQLMLLPGVGEATAQKIIDYRTENNRFHSIEEIMNVSGIGEKKFEQMKQYIKAE